jgi:hypothetical protein
MYISTPKRKMAQPFKQNLDHYYPSHSIFYSNIAVYSEEASVIRTSERRDSLEFGATTGIHKQDE